MPGIPLGGGREVGDVRERPLERSRHLDHLTKARHAAIVSARAASAGERLAGGLEIHAARAEGRDHALDTAERRLER